MADACNIDTGKLDANAYVENGKYPFFTCASEPTMIDSYAYNDDVILIAGNNAQGNFHLNRFNGKFNAYQRTYILTIKDGYDLDYIYYALKLELKRLKEHSQGSQTKFLTMPILIGIHFKKVTFLEQQKIAKVLSTLDKKIELNNQINQNLEAMAKTLYDYWFVQFDFPFDFAQGKPNANDKPYKSSGGKMVYNEELKREIPEGWEMDIINNIINVKDGTHDSPKKSDSGYYLITSKHLKASGIDFNEASLISSRDFDLVNKRSKVDKGDFLVSMIGTVGLTYWVKNMDTKFAIKNIGLFKTSQRPDISDYLYASLNSSFGKAYIQSKMSTGTSQPYITLGAIREIPIILPSTNILNLFVRSVSNIYSKIHTNIDETQKLTQLRDWLLPMLMNGQVSVADATEQVEELMVAEPTQGYGA